jgi:hypothetical protein
MMKPEYKAAAPSYTPTPIEFTNQEIARYQEEHFRTYREHISKEVAARKYANVVRFVRIALRHQMKKRKERRYAPTQEK